MTPDPESGRDAESGTDPGEGPALAAPPVDADPGEAYASARRRWQGIPGVEWGPDGALWATWYSGGETEGPDNYVVVVRSDDGGESWSDPRLVVDPPGYIRAFDPCLWRDPTDRLWLFWAQASVHWDGRGGVWAVTRRAGDDGWSAPRRLCDGVMLNKPTVLESGDWLLPATVWSIPDNLAERSEELGLDVSERELARRRHALNVDGPCYVYRSRDGGETVERLGGAAIPGRTVDEHAVVERRDGTLWLLARTSYGIGEAVSRDGGRTWEDCGDSGLGGPDSRFFVGRLQSGRLLLVNHATDDRRADLAAHLSDDDGESWYGGLVVDGRDGVSYPDATQDPDGRVYVVYDHDRHGEGEILAATFRESDVAAGGRVGDDAGRRLRVARL